MIVGYLVNFASVKGRLLQKHLNDLPLTSRGGVFNPTLHRLGGGEHSPREAKAGGIN